MSYPVPDGEVMDEQIVKKSRFITHIQHTSNKEEAISFIKNIKKRYPDARHHCWAYIAGHPTATTDIASSDDGEPQGTAGKPILNVLQHRHIGEITIIVVRYFGGIKLGAGGLVRAYSSSAHLAVEKLKTKILRDTTRFKISFEYAMEPKLQHFLKTQDLTLVSSQYSEQVTMLFEVEKQHYDIVIQSLTDITAGKLHLHDD